MFYKQIILQGELPSEVKLPAHPIVVGNMTQAEINVEIQKGFDDAQNNRVKPATEAFSDIRKKYSVKISGERVCLSECFDSSISV